MFIQTLLLESVSFEQLLLISTSIDLITQRGKFELFCLLWHTRIAMQCDDTEAD